MRQMTLSYVQTCSFKMPVALSNERTDAFMSHLQIQSLYFHVTHMDSVKVVIAKSDCVLNNMKFVK